MAFRFPVFVTLILSAVSVIHAQSTYNCTSFFVPITVTNVTTLVLPFPHPFPDGYAATSLCNAITLRDAPPVTPNLTTFTGTFNISAKYCTPHAKTARSSTIQLLSHGLGFDKTYWDFHLPDAPNNNSYSYTAAALTAGYSTLAYDRLGCGLSTVANPYTEIQATVELAVLATLTTELKAGKLLPPSISSGAAPPPPSKILHVGHSWGSELSNALAASAPHLSDGLVLTGYSHLFDYQGNFVANSAFHLASESQPARFANHSTGYLTWADRYDNQYSFFAYPYFDPAVLAHAEATKWPFTVGEFVSQAALNYTAAAFTGPVLYLVGAQDLIFCGGDCVGLFGAQSAARVNFPQAGSWERHIHPDSGHGINLHYNATGAYEVVMDWATRHGL